MSILLGLTKRERVSLSCDRARRGMMQLVRSQAPDLQALQRFLTTMEAFEGKKKDGVV